MMDIVVQWTTILSPFIAVLIAWWMSNSSKKETARQIAALEENTTKQIESVKELARIQIEISILQLRKELWEARQLNLNTMKKEGDVMDDHFAMMGIPHNDIVARIQDKREKERNLSYERDFYSKQIQVLDNFIKSLNEIKNELLKK